MYHHTTNDMKKVHILCDYSILICTCVCCEAACLFRLCCWGLSVLVFLSLLNEWPTCAFCFSSACVDVYATEIACVEQSYMYHWILSYMNIYFARQANLSIHIQDRATVHVGA